MDRDTKYLSNSNKATEHIVKKSRFDAEKFRLVSKFDYNRMYCWKDFGKV